MGKVIHNDVFDAALSEVATSTKIYLCTSEPANDTAADAASLIPAHTMTGGDFTNADGDVSGRKVTVAAQNGLTADVSGTATHVVLTDGTSVLLATTCTSQAITSGNTVNIGSFDFEITDPS
jgi:hypothetical protein